MFLIECTTSVDFWLQKIEDLYEKPHFTITILDFGSYEADIPCTSMKLFYGGPGYYRDG